MIRPSVASLMESGMRPSGIFLTVACVAALAAFPARAGVLVFGTGIGHACYEQTLLDPTPARNMAALAICDQAVADMSVNAYNHAAALTNRADIRLRMADYDGAIADADRAIAIEPDMGAAHLNRGAGLIGLKRHADALPALDRAITVGLGKLQLAYFDRGMVKENLGDVRGAYLDYLKAADLDPNFAEARAELARFRVIRR
jgi:tetratricopeptide (TPR) repeat protein